MTNQYYKNKRNLKFTIQFQLWSSNSEMVLWIDILKTAINWTLSNEQNLTPMRSHSASIQLLSVIYSLLRHLKLSKRNKNLGYMLFSVLMSCTTNRKKVLNYRRNQRRKTYWKIQQSHKHRKENPIFFKERETYLKICELINEFSCWLWNA